MCKVRVRRVHPRSRNLQQLIALHRWYLILFYDFFCLWFLNLFVLKNHLVKIRRIQKINSSSGGAIFDYPANQQRISIFLCFSDLFGFSDFNSFPDLLGRSDILRFSVFVRLHHINSVYQLFWTTIDISSSVLERISILYGLPDLLGRTNILGFWVLFCFSDIFSGPVVFRNCIINSISVIFTGTIYNASAVDVRNGKYKRSRVLEWNGNVKSGRDHITGEMIKKILKFEKLFWREKS